jgi:AcrR family transcriptional regulator
MSDGDTATEIMCATKRALCCHGYADLTMQDIAAESSKSKAALHYHYDSKHDLLCAFLDHLYEQFVALTTDIGGETARDRLLALIDVVLEPPGGDRKELETALLEIRAQAPYTPEFRDRLARFNEHLLGELSAILEAGVADGTIAPTLDPEATAQFIVTVLVGATTRRATAGTDQERIRTHLAAYVEMQLTGDIS